MADPLDLLQQLAKLLGLVGILVLVVAALLFLYIVLDFGHRTLAQLLSFTRELAKRLFDEFKGEHPAIRVEVRLHYLFGLVMVISILAVVAHALVPWVRPDVHDILVAAFWSTFAVSCVLGAVSLVVVTRI